MTLDFDECDRARAHRDPSYDGRFFTGVRTTGVYSRPVCPARSARSCNVEFFPSAAAAEAAGFRPCLRCRPETIPFSPAWRGSGATVLRAMRSIENGFLDRHPVSELADRLGIGSRHLLRVFRKYAATTPQAAAACRIHFCALQHFS
jgi:AraC family transcriptional regulator of adaptative response/methylated-DNA-[protein]-cysteine methyltransferase